MATNQTTTYQLNQWEPTDAVQRVEFNQDNAKMDAALKSLADQVVQKADQSTLNTLISAVNQKADASTVSSLSSLLNSEISQRQAADSSLQAALALKGNCQIYFTSYVGDGTYTKTLTFPGKPLLVLIQAKNLLLHAVYGNANAMSSTNGVGGELCMASWGENSLTWNFEHPHYACNLSGENYLVLAFLAADA